MRSNGIKQLCGSIVKNFNIAVSGRITGALLLQHLDHHVVGGLVNKGNHDLLTVKCKGSICILLRRSLRNLPDEIPGQGFRQGITKLFHIGLIDIAGFRGAHIRQGIIMTVKLTFLQELRNDLILCRTVEEKLRTVQPVFFIGKKCI